MANIQSGNCSLLNQIQDLLRRKPNSYDVIFYVGPAKKEVKAVRILLEAASPVLEKKFELWDVAVIRKRSGRGISLPEFDPEAFVVFVKLTMLNMWTRESLENLHLTPDQIVNLVSICSAFEMKKALRNLEHLMEPFYREFAAFKSTPQFLQLSHTNLLIILSSDNLPLNEFDVFDCACRWAKVECAKRQIEATSDNIRLVLGEIVFQIRFPLMTAKEFTQCVKQHDILTPAEGYEVLKFISSDDTEKFSLHPSQFPFKTKTRVMSLEPKLEMKVKPEMLTLCLAIDSPIVDSPPFVCDGRLSWNFIATKRKILVHGVGFLGPVDEDASYDVTVKFAKWEGFSKLVDMERMEKRVSARKSKVFHLMFDEPITFLEGAVDKWTNHYNISYYLKGPVTKSFQRTTGAEGECTKRDGRNKFRFWWQSDQLAEILYTNA